jgi:hypothetical protein
MTVQEMLEDEWFKKGYKSAEFDEKYDTTLDDVDAVFNDSEVSPWSNANSCIPVSTSCRNPSWVQFH